MRIAGHPAFKRVAAIDKCFAVLELLAKAKDPIGISDISRKLGLNKSTVFNMIHTLIDLQVLENKPDGKFAFGTRFYVLANIAGNRSRLIQTAHPYLEKINEKTKLSAFLGLRSGPSILLIDKVDSAYGIKLSSEIGMHMPVLAGAGIKAALSQLSDKEIDEVLARSELKRYTPNSITDKARYKKEIGRVREQGIAFDREEYIEGMVAFAIPVIVNSREVQAAIWAVGLARQVTPAMISKVTIFLKQVSKEINQRLQ